MMAAMSSVPSEPHRPRRLRRSAILRDAVVDVDIRPNHLIFPVFVTNLDQSKPVSSMPEVRQLPVREAVETIRGLAGRGLRQFLLFGVTPTDKKNPQGSFASSPQAPVNRVLREVREAGIDVVMYADLCFCEYTDHGHCGILSGPPTDAQRSGSAQRSVEVDNDATIARLAQTAVVQAQAGADVVAPSGMMDGQVGAIRRALDEAGYPHTAILAYSIKYASTFYGPFREAGEGGMKFGDRRGYQMDFRRSREWRIELEADLAQGADMVMVKPAATYLDIVRQVREATSVPVAAYHVSGEYAMLHAAAQRGWLDLQSAAVETTCAIRRAGADLIVTYFAPRLIEWL